MKFLIVCHGVVVVAIVLLQLLDFNVSATPIQRGDEEHPGPKTEEERKEAYEAFYKGEQTIEYPSNHSSRNVISNMKTRWLGGKVPYVINSTVSGYTSLIQASMQDYHNKTCVRFVPRTFEKDYIKIFAGQGCYSHVGMIGGEQPVSLGQGCMFQGTIVHELGHALGFFHEQNRSDRDKFLNIYFNNIQSKMVSQFFLLKPDENLLLDPFDYDSIMIYGNKTFSKDGYSITMEAKTGQKLYEPYEKAGLSDSDVRRLNIMYKC